jgi:hypothetical protein
MLTRELSWLDWLASTVLIAGGLAALCAAARRLVQR